MSARPFLAVLAALAVAGCARSTRGVEYIHAPLVELDRVGSVTYYDRNLDGIVDYEFHDLGCCDRNWALLDTDHDGRYDRELRLGYSFTESPTNLPVASSVVISPHAPSIPGH